MIMNAAVEEFAHARQAFVERCLTDPHRAAEMGARAQQLVQSQLGATQRTIALLDTLVLPKTGAGTIRSAA